MSIIDINGVLSFLDLDARPKDGSAADAGDNLGEHLSFERKVLTCLALQSACSLSGTHQDDEHTSLHPHSGDTAWWGEWKKHITDAHA